MNPNTAESGRATALPPFALRSWPPSLPAPVDIGQPVIAAATPKKTTAAKPVGKRADHRHEASSEDTDALVAMAYDTRDFPSSSSSSSSPASPDMTVADATGEPGRMVRTVTVTVSSDPAGAASAQGDAPPGSVGLGGTETDAHAMVPSFEQSAVKPLSVPGSSSATLLTLAGVALGGVTLAAMSKGGGDSPSEVHATSASKLSVSVLAGPLKAPVQIEAFDKDGKLVASAVSDDNGNADLSFAAAISGPLLLKASGLAGAGISHLDEATGTIQSLSVPLRAVVVINGDRHVTITPLSELAVAKMGLTGNNAAVSSDTVNNVSASVAHLFGLDDLVGPALSVFDARFDASDGISMAERFGQQLAALSGADQVTGSAASTLTRLGSDIDLATGTMSTAGQDLLATGRNIFASSQNAAFATLIAATVPLAPTITNSAAAAAALVLGPMADGKVDYLEAANGLSIPVALPSNAIAGDTLDVILGGTPGDSRQTAQTASHVLTLGEIAAGYALVGFSAAQLVAGGDGLKLPTSTVTNSHGTSATMALGPVYVDAPPEQTVYLPPPLPTTFTTPDIRLKDGEVSTINGHATGITMVVRYDGIRDQDTLQVLRDGVSLGAAVTHTVSNHEQQQGYAEVPVTLAQLGADGTMKLGVIMTNGVNTATASNELAIRLDATPPALVLAPAPNGDAFVDAHDTGYAFRASYPDMVAGDRIALTIASAGGVPVALGNVYPVSGTDGANHYVDFSATLPQLGGDGAKTITAVATDVMGNVSAPVALQLTVDRTVPNPALAFVGGPTNHYLNHNDLARSVVVSTVGMADRDVIEIRNTAANPLDPASTANQLLASHTLSASEALLGSYTLNINKASLSVDGSYGIVAIEKDLAGNVGVSAPITLDVASQLPDVHIALPTGVNGTVTFMEGGIDFLVHYDSMHVGDIIQMKTGSTSLANGYHQVVQLDIDNAKTVDFHLSAADMLGNFTNRQIYASVTDVASNSNTSPQMAITIDTDVPIPHIDLQAGALSSLNSIAHLTHLVVSYTGMAANDTIQLFDGSTALAGLTHTISGPQAGAGNWTFDVDRSDFLVGGSLVSGAHDIYASVIDAATNPGVSTVPVQLILA